MELFSTKKTCLQITSLAVTFLMVNFFEYNSCCSQYGCRWNPFDWISEIADGLERYQNMSYFTRSQEKNLNLNRDSNLGGRAPG